MHQFENLASSSSSSSNASTYVEEVEDEQKVKDYWYEFTDEDNDDETGGEVISSEEKVERKLRNLCTVFDNMMAADKKDFIKSQNSLADVEKEFETFFRKYVRVPSCIMDMIENIPEFGELLEEYKVDEDDEEATKEMRRNYKALIALDGKYSSFLELVEKKKITVAQLDENEDDDDEGTTESKVLTEEEYIAILTNANSSTHDIRKIADACKTLGYMSCHVSALALYANGLIEKGRAKPTLHNLTQAFTFLNRSYDALCENPTLQYSDRPGQMSPTTVYIHGGYHVILRNLADNLLHLAQSQSSKMLQGYSDNLLKDIVELENSVVDFADSLVGFYQTQKVKSPALDCCQVLLNIVARRPQNAHALLYEMMKRKSGVVVEKSVMKTVKNIFNAFVTSKNEGLKNKAIAAIAYQLALDGQYRQARDFMHRCGLPSYVEGHQGDVPLCVLYNSAVVQIALAAFSEGDMNEASRLFRNISSQETDLYVLIAQFQLDQILSIRAHKYIPLSDKEVTDLCDDSVPFHNQIPLAHVDAALILSALIVDTLNEAKAPHTNVNRIDAFNKAIIYGNRITSNNSKQYSTTLQDQTSIAYHALKEGNYKRAAEAVKEMAVWKSFPNGPAVLSKYLEILKDTAVLIFCLSSRGMYSILSVAQLAALYELPESKVRTLVNRLITEENGLVAYWDAEDKFLHIDASNANRLQHYVLGTAEWYFWSQCRVDLTSLQQHSVLLSDREQDLFELKVGPLFLNNISKSSFYLHII